MKKTLSCHKTLRDSYLNSRYRQLLHNLIADYINGVFSYPVFLDCLRELQHEYFTNRKEFPYAQTNDSIF